jgi:DNA-directed RNA polymerase subunit RPC12/RpoP
MPFCVATCAKCSGRFRLVWRIGKRKLPMSAVVRLTCPTCGHRFEQVVVKLVVFSVGAEAFPKAVVVEESALLEG